MILMEAMTDTEAIVTCILGVSSMVCVALIVIFGRR